MSEKPKDPAAEKAAADAAAKTVDATKKTEDEVKKVSEAAKKGEEKLGKLTEPSKAPDKVVLEKRAAFVRTLRAEAIHGPTTLYGSMIRSTQGKSTHESPPKVRPQPDLHHKKHEVHAKEEPHAKKPEKKKEKKDDHGHGADHGHH